MLPHPDSLIRPAGPYKTVHHPSAGGPRISGRGKNGQVGRLARRGRGSSRNGIESSIVSMTTGSVFWARNRHIGQPSLSPDSDPVFCLPDSFSQQALGQPLPPGACMQQWQPPACPAGPWLWSQAPAIAIAR